ncbi:DUF2797 domain-containing protein [Chitinophagales bacterium]|nr:DUF2797 domain-containing protein [Chitinophagales bacterium]
MEVQMKAFFTDKTNWQRMLKNEVVDMDLLEAKEEALNYLDEEYFAYISDQDEVISIHYPVPHYPDKVKSIKLDSTPIIESKLHGIKGQYLYLDNNQVINIRNHSGYLVHIEY